MDLFSIGIQGFRRFKDKTTLRTDGKLVAILGPNEAGKSSLLKAIEYIGNDTETDLTNISRGGDANSLEITAKFSLSDDDLKEVELKAGSVFTVTKSAAGQRNYEISPEPKPRDTSQRVKLVTTLNKVLGNTKFLKSFGEGTPLHTQVRTLIPQLEVDAEDLPRVPNLLTNAAKAFDGEELNKFAQYIQNLPTEMKAQAELEKQPNPYNAAVNKLKSRMHKFFFLMMMPEFLKQNMT